MDGGLALIFILDINFCRLMKNLLIITFTIWNYILNCKTNVYCAVLSYLTQDLSCILSYSSWQLFM